jgi:exodeoxyribonuclease VII small subunit
MPKPSDKQPKFEEAIEQLESIIDRIESGEVGLEECIAQYERGMKLVGRCQAILDKAQQRITELTTDADGKLRAHDLPPEEEADTDAGDLEGEFDSDDDSPPEGDSEDHE